MKKGLLIILSCVVGLSACDFGGKSKVQAEKDSLALVLSQKEDELNEFWGVFNEIQEGFRQINIAENRVDLQRGSIMEQGATAREKIKEDMEFIAKTMNDNKAQIAKLEALLKNNKNASANLSKTLESLKAELAEKTNRISELQSELAAKNIRIQELDAAVSNLAADVESLAAANDAKAEAVEEQDRIINTGWFVFGTKSELKDQKILKGGNLFKSAEVLSDADFNKDYFTEIDIRTTKNINLYSKSAKLLTSHPEGSYTLEKNSKGEYVLNITNAKTFWSLSKYLVILVK